MKAIAALLKQVPDTGLPLPPPPAAGPFKGSEGISYAISPYDEFALEAALRLKTALKAPVIALSLGPERVKESLKAALALGADEGRHILLEEDQGLQNPLASAHILAEALKKIDFSLILCGKQSADEGNGAVGAMTAEFLGVPMVSGASNIEVKEGAAIHITREAEGGGEEILEGKLPLFISVAVGAIEARYPTLQDIMKAKAKPLHTEKADSAALAAMPGFQVKKLKPPPPRAAPCMIEGAPKEQARELVRLLREKEGFFKKDGAKKEPSSKGLA